MEVKIFEFRVFGNTTRGLRTEGLQKEPAETQGISRASPESLHRISRGSPESLQSVSREFPESLPSVSRDSPENLQKVCREPQRIYRHKLQRLRESPKCLQKASTESPEGPQRGAAATERWARRVGFKAEGLVLVALKRSVLALPT